ncbi:MAG: DUF1007 family protein [Rhodobacterales bacterium]|nr:DUF1007 family protein [Rhodobacterales bacterium]
MRAAILALALAAAAGSVAAHPHVFIDTGVEVIFDARGRAQAIRIRWTYDELFSLLVLQDRGLDADYDGVLTAEETAALRGFDMAWEPGFAGDTYALQAEVPLTLGPPTDWDAGLTDGRLWSTHLRALAVPVDPAAGDLVVQSYDPGFYTAYSITGQPVLTGRADCSAQVWAPDPAAADAILQAALAEYAGAAVEADFPAVGHAYAEEVRVTCAAPR